MSSHAGPIRPLYGSAPISEAMERIRAMIERKAPLFMRVGGWSGGAPTVYKAGRRRLTPEQRAKLLEMAREGHFFTQIGAALNISDSTAGKIARMNGIIRGIKGNGRVRP